MRDHDAPTAAPKILPPVGRIQGLLLEKGPTPKASSVGLQYVDLDGQWHETRMGFLDAMYLLSLLKGLQLDTDFPFPDDPRDPKSKPVRPSKRGA